MARRKRQKSESKEILVGLIFLVSLVLTIIVTLYISYTSPIIRIEHFNNLFGIIGSLATALTLIYFVVQTNQTQKEKNLEIKISEAKNVSAWLDKEYLGDHLIRIFIYNGSQIPIYNVVLSIVNRNNDDSDGRQMPNKLRQVIDVVPPGKWVVITTQDIHGCGFLGGIEMGFEDSSNHSWIRKGNGSLHTISGSIFDYYDLSRPMGFTSIKKVE